MLKYLAIEKGKKESISCWAWPWHGVCRSTHFSPQRFMPQSHPWLRPFLGWRKLQARLFNPKLKGVTVIKMLTLEFQIDIWFQINVGGTFFNLLKSIHWVNSSAQGSCFHKMTAAVSFASLERFGEKDPFIKKWRLFRHVYKVNGFLVKKEI